VDHFGVRLAAIDEHYEEQNQIPRHADNLVTLLAVGLDEAVVGCHVMRIVENFPRSLERHSVCQLIPLRLYRDPT